MKYREALDILYLYIVAKELNLLNILEVDSDPLFQIERITSGLISHPNIEVHEQKPGAAPTTMVLEHDNKGHEQSAEEAKSHPKMDADDIEDNKGNTVKPFVQSPLNDRDPFNFERGTGQRVLVFWIFYYIY